MFTSEEQDELVRVATESIHRKVKGSGFRGKSGQHLEHTASGNLLEKCGAFVTIYEHGSLRGCLGLITSDKPLIETVAEMAARTASDDPRFFPVAPEELNELEVEISVLSPLKEISDVSEIELGRDGLLIEFCGRRGLLLPQVATKNAWDKETFLEETCVKAGLPRDQWKSADSRIFAFTTEIIKTHQ